MIEMFQQKWDRRLSMHILLTARPALLGSGLRVCLGLAVSGCLELRGAFSEMVLYLGCLSICETGLYKTLLSSGLYYLAFFTFAVLLFGVGGHLWLFCFFISIVLLLHFAVSIILLCAGRIECYDRADIEGRLRGQRLESI